MMHIGLVIFLVGVVVMLASCALCGGWADRRSIRPFVWVFSVGLLLVAVGYGLLLASAAR